MQNHPNSTIDTDTLGSHENQKNWIRSKSQNLVWETLHEKQCLVDSVPCLVATGMKMQLDVCRRGAFPPDVPTLDHDSLASNVPNQQESGTAGGSGSTPGQWGEAKGLMSSEHTVWMGDLNYRLSMPDAEVTFPAGPSSNR